ncbi:MAG: hypothetical protein V3V61_04075, partial [Gammaproteobacteria bacterium]
MKNISLKVYTEKWHLQRAFTISRGTRQHAEVVVVEINQDNFTGRGECTPYARYQESVASVMAEVKAIEPQICRGTDRA